MTLLQQYKKYISENPDSKITFREWQDRVLTPFIKGAIDQIGEINPDEWDREEEKIQEEESIFSPYSPYCKICSCCGESGCCSPLSCEMNKDGDYCGTYLNDLKFGYSINEEFCKKIYDRMNEDLKKEYDIVWEEVYDKIYKSK
jgi:hypothetical protein